MAEFVTEQIFEGSVAECFHGISQYEKYPEYLPGVTSITVLPANVAGSKCRVRYDLKLIKSFHYILNMFDESPNKIWWNLDESNLMKVSNGSWDLTEIDAGSTKAIYKVEAVFKGLVPQKIVDQVTKATVPGMMKGFQKLISDSQS